MENFTNWQIFGFILGLVGYVVGMIGLITFKKNNTRWFYVGVISVMIGFAIVLISAILTAPANHAGVGFLNRKVPQQRATGGLDRKTVERQDRRTVQHLYGFTKKRVDGGARTPFVM